MSRVPQSVRLLGTNRGDREVDDWYQEPQSATVDLLRAEPFAGEIYDPACGEGNVVRAALGLGYEAFGSDVVNRADGHFGVDDFLAPAHADQYVSWPVDNIISNPPYRDAERFIDCALERSRFKVAMLLRLAFLEGQGRRAAFDRWPMSRVLVFSKRLCMPPAGRGIETKGGTVAFAWFVFDHAHRGAATVGWL